ncbi:MAG: OprO/OprP family phosphate-selective porin, partial [Betaproteobacteria bacterium]
GIISEEEFNDITGNTPEGRAAARAERRTRVQKEALDAQKAEAAKERFNGRWNNGLVFETPDRRTTFSLGGRVHADYRYFEEDTAASTFDIRRAYLTLQGKWNEWLTWDLTGDFAQSTNALDVGWINAAWSDKLQVRAGQFKMPFSLEELTSSRFIDFQERSFVNRLAPAKERGVMVHGVPYTGLTYAVALSNGQGKNTNETSPNFDSPDVIGRATVNVAELLQQQAKAVYHFGAAFSSGEFSTNATTVSGLGNSTTEPRGATFFTPTAFNSPSVDRTRYGFETALAYGPLKLQGEIAQANFKGRTATGSSFDKNIDTYYLSLHWMITGERYAETYRNGVFGRMAPITPYEPGGSGSGAWELAVRFSEFDATDFPLVAGASNAATLASGLGGTYVGTSLATPTASNRAKALTVGLKWIWTPNFKIYLNYTDTKFDNGIRFSPTGGTPFTSDHERAVTMRAAFDW